MLITIRALGVALMSVGLLAGSAGAARAADEPGGTITFRLTLRGDVADGDSFSLAVNASNRAIISPGIRCGPGSEDYTGKFTPCQPGNFEFVVEGRVGLPVGTTLTYVWARANTVIYTDTVTVTESAQVFTVVYDYGGGSPLPDTATRGSPQAIPIDLAVPLGVIIMVLAVYVGVGTGRRAL